VVGRVLVDAPQAAAVIEEVGEGAIAERRPDGSVVVELPVTNRAAFRSVVLGWLDAAEVVAPPELRDEMAAWLERIARGAA
jgi:predicted DNA-binding transcriptional regulator YafY